MTTTIKLPNGSTAVSFVPEESKDLAIVHLPTLQRIIRHLDTELFDKIRDLLIRRLMATGNLKDMVDLLQDEVYFHKTVNLIESYKPEMTMAEKMAMAGNDDEGIQAGIDEANLSMS